MMKDFIKEVPKNLFAGFVVSLVALPLGLGLAIASEAPPISGVIASIVGGTVVAILGGSQLTNWAWQWFSYSFIVCYHFVGRWDLYQGYLYTLAAIIVSVC